MLLKNKTYHFYEIAISGLSGSGKSTLIAKLLNEFKNEHKVFYAKHDAHRFEMDHPGKDTANAIKSGASAVSIFNDSKWATIHQSTLPMIEQKLLAIDYDFAIVEGHKHTEIPKLLFLDDNNETMNEYRQGKFKNVLGFITPDGMQSVMEGLPCFGRDNVSSLFTFVLEYFKQQYLALPLNALILVGGKSSRMGQDKARINYHGEEQARYLAKILRPHCQNIFYSCREDQAQDPYLQDCPIIEDQFRMVGPLGGILSYFQKWPLSRVLVVACDMPFIDQESIAQLVQQESAFKLATAFINEERKWPEPLFTIYQPKAYARMLQLLSVGYDCPMKVLFNSDIKKIIPKNYRSIANINTPAEMVQTYQTIQQNAGEKGHE